MGAGGGGGGSRHAIARHLAPLTPLAPLPTPLAAVGQTAGQVGAGAVWRALKGRSALAPVAHISVLAACISFMGRCRVQFSARLARKCGRFFLKKAPAEHCPADFSSISNERRAAACLPAALFQLYCYSSPAAACRWCAGSFAPTYSPPSSQWWLSCMTDVCLPCRCHVSCAVKNVYASAPSISTAMPSRTSYRFAFSVDAFYWRSTTHWYLCPARRYCPGYIWRSTFFFVSNDCVVYCFSDGWTDATSWYSSARRYGNADVRSRKALYVACRPYCLRINGAIVRCRGHASPCLSSPSCDCLTLRSARCCG